MSSKHNYTQKDLSQMQVSTLLMRQMPQDTTIQERMILLVLADRYRAGKTIDISLDEIARLCAIGKRSVSTYLKSLCDKEYVHKVRVGLGENNQYELDLTAMKIDTNDFSHK